MTAAAMEHELLVIERGKRAGLYSVVAVHSTARGMACGGCRAWSYKSVWDGVDDALRLSRAMTYKNAAARLDHGGGKGVIVVPAGERLEGDRRRAALHDFGDVVEGLDGAYGTAADVGTTADDMITVRERTEYAYCLPPSHGGSGEPSAPTAIGLELALLETCAAVYGTDAVDGRSFGVIGLGQVGSRIARALAARGASLTVTDVDAGRRDLAESLGATWVEPATALQATVDVLVPCALGGILTAESVETLRCKAVAGAANNQLADDGVADLLRRRGILYAPDFIVNAGGAIQAQMMDVDGCSPAEVDARLPVIRENLHEIFERSAARGTSPLTEANRLAESLIPARRSGALAEEAGWTS